MIQELIQKRINSNNQIKKDMEYITSCDISDFEYEQIVNLIMNIRMGRKILLGRGCFKTIIPTFAFILDSILPRDVTFEEIK